MFYKLLMSFLIVSVMANCGGGGSGTPDLDNAAPGSVALSAGQTIQATSLDAIKAVDLEASAVGAKISVTEGVLEGIEFELAEPVAGNPALKIGGQGSDTGEQGLEFYVLTDPNIWLRGNLNLLAVDEKNENSYSVESNGTTIYVYNYKKSLGTSVLEGEELEISSGNSTVYGDVTYVRVGDQTSLGFGYNLKSDELYEIPSQTTLDYSGRTFIYTMDATYVDDTSSLNLDFDALTGSFSANNFEAKDGAPDLEILIENAISLDKSNGVLRSTSGSISAGNTQSPINLMGVLTSDSKAAAGALIVGNPEDVSGFVGGSFAVAAPTGNIPTTTTVSAE